jgi:hypothetical protein
VAFALPALCPEQRGDDDDGSRVWAVSVQDDVMLRPSLVCDYKGARGLGICRTMGQKGEYLWMVDHVLEGRCGVWSAFEVILGTDTGERRNETRRNA